MNDFSLEFCSLKIRIHLHANKPFYCINDFRPAFAECAERTQSRIYNNAKQRYMEQTDTISFRNIWHNQLRDVYPYEI